MIALLAEIIISGTLIVLGPPSEQGALAEVEMRNNQLNGPQDDGAYHLSADLPGGPLTVGIAFTWDSTAEGADRITVTPPDGVVCIPSSCVLELPEGTAGTLTLWEWVGF